MTEHTLGPWRVARDDRFGFFYVIGGDHVVANAAVTPLPLLENQANARLIAAAPELLKTLKTVQPYFEGEHHYDHPHCRQIRAAIAKATSEEVAA
jgi:hypothetical protein